MADNVTKIPQNEKKIANEKQKLVEYRKKYHRTRKNASL